MRLWSLHPSFLDKQGILGVWREGLLAQKVLTGKTRGYINHPQLIRFKKTTDPLLYIGTYLYFVYVEGSERGYKFDANKILKYDPKIDKIEVTIGQLYFERTHLLKKLEKRDPEKYKEDLKREPQPHPVFRVVKGDVEPWEKSKTVKAFRNPYKLGFS